MPVRIKPLAGSIAVFAILLVMLASSAAAQAPATAPARGRFGGRGPASRPAFIPEGYNDHQNMMSQLGIKTLRPGKSGSNQTGKGFEEATANEWMPTLPDVLKMKDGTKVTTPEQWARRRAEIAEDFEREVYGRIPANVPKVTWEVTETTQGQSGGIPTVTKALVGRVDNSAFPQITVNIQAMFTVPANSTGPVPIVIEFGSAADLAGEAEVAALPGHSRRSAKAGVMDS